MKIRNGFVSNSSSSSFLVEVPDELKIDKNSFKDIWDAHSDLAEYWEEVDEDGNEDLMDEQNVISKDFVVEELNKYLDEVRYGGGGLFRGDGAVYRGLFWAVEKFLKHHNCIVSIGDGHGDGEDEIVPFEDLRKRK